MTDKTVFYLDTTPLGPGHFITKGSQFFAREINVEPDVAEKLIKQYEDFRVVQSWLKFLYPLISNRQFEVEIPKEIKEILCLGQSSEEKPKQKVSAPPSSKKSPKPRSEQASSLFTKTKPAS